MYMYMYYVDILSSDISSLTCYMYMYMRMHLEKELVYLLVF